MLDLRQIWTWDGQQRLVGTIFINMNQIAAIEEYSNDPTFDPSGVFSSSDDSGVVFGLTVWLITMSSGQQIQVPVPRSYKSSIWEQLQIHVP